MRVTATTVKRAQFNGDFTKEDLAQHINIMGESRVQGGVTWDPVTADEVPDYVVDVALSFSEAVKKWLEEYAWSIEHDEIAAYTVSDQLYTLFGPNTIYTALLRANYPEEYKRDLPEDYNIEDMFSYLQGMLKEYVVENSLGGMLSTSLVSALYELRGIHA